MLETHNYIDVRFQDKPRYLQPAGIYWLESMAVKAVAWSMPARCGRTVFLPCWP